MASSPSSPTYKQTLYNVALEKGHRSDAPLLVRPDNTSPMGTLKFTMVVNIRQVSCVAFWKNHLAMPHFYTNTQVLILRRTFH
jgi:hypothetical protein